MIVRGTEPVLVQGITGRQASFWSERMRAYGTPIRAGVHPRKGGSEHLGVPVFASAREAAAALELAVSVLFVPPAAAKAAALDAIEAGIGKLVILTEHVPVHDVMYLLAAAREAGTAVLGPNTAGLVTPGECFVGFMPAFESEIFRPGTVGVISRSGSLGTLACLNLAQAGLGQSAFVGIGGDPVIGTTTAEALSCLAADPRTEAIALLGEIGGSMEEEAAEVVAALAKPVVAFIAGAAAPPGRRMGHAGAIVSAGRGTWRSKRDALEGAGATVLATPTAFGAVIGERLAGR